MTTPASQSVPAYRGLEPPSVHRLAAALDAGLRARVVFIGAMIMTVTYPEHLGGTGAEADRLAIDHAVSLNLPPVIRHASALGFFTLKCAAYRDRGATLPVGGSKDLGDLVALLATRPALASENAAAPCLSASTLRVPHGDCSTACMRETGFPSTSPRCGPTTTTSKIASLHC